MRWLPRLGGDKAVPLALETKDAPTRRASAGRGFVYAQQPYTPPGDNLERLVKDGYERVIWAFKAIDAIADKMSGWPIECMEGFGDDAKPVDDDCLPLLNVYSNDIERAAKYFRYRLISQLLLSKRGVFVEVIPSRGGSIAALNLLPPAWTRIVPDPDTFIKGFRVEPPGWEQSAYIDLPVYDPDKKAGVLWIRKPHPTDPYSSITPLEAASISLDLDFYARMYNRNFLLNDGRAGQIVAIKGGLSPEDAMEIKARFQPGMGRAGQTTVIEADSISVQDTAVTPRDAQYAELRNITKEDLLIALGTPESVVGNASGRTFDNADAEKENWLDVTVLPLSQVIDAGFDPLTEGGYDDERRLRHDVSGEPVLRRRHEQQVEKARQDFLNGLISADEWRELAEKDPIGRPGSRVLWIPGGKIAVGKEDDESAAAALKPAGAPPEPDLSAMGGGLPPEGPQTDLTGFDSEIDSLVSDPNAAQALAQAAPQLRLVKGGLDHVGSDEYAEPGNVGVETKAFNPHQPRYPQGHPLGGQFMDVGDTALWLAGRPLKDGTPASAVADPNPGSTASPATAPGGSGGAARFLSSPDPKVRAAAHIVSFPASYAHPRVLGAPPAIDLRNPKNVKLVSLRKGDVVNYRGQHYAVAETKKSGPNQHSLVLVNATGDVQALTASSQGTLNAIARTPHPTVVAQAKRDITAAARAMGAGGGGPAANPAAPAATPTAPAPVGTWVVSQGVFSGRTIIVSANGYGVVQSTPSQRAQTLSPALVTQLQAAGHLTPSVHAAPAPAQAAGWAGRGPNTPAGVTVQLPPPGTYENSAYPNSQFIISPSGDVSVLNTRVGNGVPQGVSTQMINNQFAPGHGWTLVGAPQAAPAVAVARMNARMGGPAVAGMVGQSGPFTNLTRGTYRGPNGEHIVVLPNGSAIEYDSSGSSAAVTSTYVRSELTGSNASSWTYVATTTTAPPVAPAAPRGAAAPAGGAPLPPAPAAPPVVGGNYPPVPNGWIAYAHPQGKVAYVDPHTGSMQVWNAQGKKASSSATAAKLAAGHGTWQQVNVSAQGIPQVQTAAAARANRAPAAAATPAPVPTIQQTAPAPPAPAPVVPSPQPAAVAAQAAPPAPAPAPTGSAVATGVLAAGVPQIRVSGWTSTGGAQGSNPAASMTDGSGKRWYVKSQDAKHADNEVAAARLYAAAGVSVPQVHRATIASGSFSGQKGSQGIASPIVQSTKGLTGRMGSNKALADAVHQDFAVHAWLGNWDAMENDNTQIGTNGRPVTIDVGGSLLFRAQGGTRTLGPTVKELTSMRGGNAAGSSARAAFAGVTPDHTDRNFVAGVERIADISPAQIKSLVDSSYPSLTQAERDTLTKNLVARRAHLAREAKVTLPEDRPGARLTAVAGAAQAAGQAAVGQPAASPAPGAVPPMNPAQVLGGTPASSVLTFPPGYPYPQVQGAPVATALAAPKPIKVASLRKGDVISYNGSNHSVISIDRKTNDIVALNSAGQRVTFHGTNHPSGSVVAVARTPHPQVVAAARRQQAAGVGPTPAQAPNVPAAGANVQRTTPSHAVGAPAAAAAKNYGVASPNGYAAIPGQTYANDMGAVMVVHSDGTATLYPVVGTGPSVTPQDITATMAQAMLDPGSQLKPIGPRILTPQSSHVVGRHSNPQGDIVDVHPDGTGTLTLHNGNVSTVSVAGVDVLLKQNPGGSNFTYDDPSPAPRAATQQAMGATMAAAVQAGPQSAPAGGWGPAGQIVPGAVFQLTSANGMTSTLTIGPRGGGKMTLSPRPAWPNGSTRNMSAASAQSALNKKNTQWKLVTPGPTAQVAAAAPAAPAAPSAPTANPYRAGQKGPFPQWRQAPGKYEAFNGDYILVDANGSAYSYAAGVTQVLTPAQVDLRLTDRVVGPRLTYTPIATPPAAPAPAAPATPGLPQWSSKVGQPATGFTGALQPNQTYTNPKTGNRMVINASGQGVLYLGPKARGGTAGVKTPAMTVRTLSAAGWVATSGPDIDTPGPQHASLVRRAQRQAGRPAPGTPVKGTVPAGATFPKAATGSVKQYAKTNIARGHTVRVNGEDWIVTEQDMGYVFGYRPGKDDPLNMVQDGQTLKWHQGTVIPGSGPGHQSFDVVEPAPVVSTNVPAKGTARAYDPALGAATTTPLVGTNWSGWDFHSQNVPADQLKAGDVILLNGREAEGGFVVTDVRADHKGRLAVYGYNGTEEDQTGTPGTEVKLFLAASGGVTRQSRVQVASAPAPLPDVPRPAAPKFGSDVERNDISDASSQAKVMSILSSPPPQLPALKSITSVGEKRVGHLMEMRGYNAHPDVISEAEMDQYVADGEIELWRGMNDRVGAATTSDMAEDYRSGPHYPGGSSGTMYGIGTYAAYGHHNNGQRDAIKFVQNSYASSARGMVVRMTIKADARVIEHDALRDALAADRSPAAMEIKRRFTFSAHSSSADAALGPYAVLMGYDVIRKSHGYQNSHSASRGKSWDDGFVVIVNRSAVRISEKTYTNNNQLAGNSPPPIPMNRARHKMNSLTARHENGVDYRMTKEP